MWMKNAIAYRLTAPDAITSDALEKRQFQPCGAMDPESRGFVPPRDDAAMVMRLSNSVSLFCLMTQKKNMVGSEVRKRTIERADALEAVQGFKPGRKQMKDIKEEVIKEMLPVAFSKFKRTYAFVDIDHNLIVIDATLSGAEDMLEALRQTLDTFPLTLIRTANSPVSAMTDWLAAGEAPEAMTVDRDCELRSVTEERAAVRYKNHALDGEEIKAHLAEGKLPTKLGMTWDDRVSFVLDEKGHLSRLQFLDVVQESIETDSESASELFDAQALMCAGETSRLIGDVINSLGGEEK